MFFLYVYLNSYLICIAALANAVRWKVRLIPADIDVSGNEVVSVQVFINADPSLAFKVND